MYCFACGQTLKENLNYCNSCGTRVERGPVVANSASSKPFAVAAILVALIGLGGVIPILRILLESRLSGFGVLLALFAYLFTVLGMFSILAAYFWRVSGSTSSKPKELAEPQEYISPASFRQANAGQLEAAHQSVMSVTDNTTQILDELPLLRERR
jgi:hypothetical protein